MHFDTDVLPKLKEKWIDSGKAKLIFRDFPLDAPGLQGRDGGALRPAGALLRRSSTPSVAGPGEMGAAVEGLRERRWKRLAKLGGMSHEDLRRLLLPTRRLENKIVESRLTARKTARGQLDPDLLHQRHQISSGAPTFEAFDQLLAGVVAEIVTARVAASCPMQIERLRLAGFKSFVDPAELAIEPGLTGIVGPNGCGKSNLVEALRWVMGEARRSGCAAAGWTT